MHIKNSLIRKGITFSSDTDTEVIVQLLEYYYKKYSNLMDAVYAVLNRIKGAYAMGILCSDYPEQIEVAVITAGKVEIYDSDRTLLEKEKHAIEWDVTVE